LLIGGKSVLKGTGLGGLVNPYREFGESAVLTGANCLISRGLKAPIRQEIGAQIKRFRLDRTAQTAPGEMRVLGVG
jgi:hypothetical protein